MMRGAWWGLAIVASLALGCGEPSEAGTGGAGGVGGGGATGAAGGQGGGAQAAADVVINEIMVNPAAVSDQAGEWVELYNAGAESVDLQGWTLLDDGNGSHTIASPLTIAPGSYAVLGRSSALGQNGGAPVDYSYGDAIALNNGGDAVVLRDGHGALADRVDYQSGAPWPVGTAGVSIELVSPDLDNAAAASWVHAVLPYGDGDLGTPGKPNGGSLGGYDIDTSVVGWQQPALSASVHFAPLDDLQAEVLGQLGAAQTSIRLAFFNIRLPEIKTLLVQKVGAGVDVQVLLDAKQQALPYNTMGDELVQAGVPVILVDNTLATDATMHDKFAVVDGHRVMTGSANCSHTALHISDEDLLTFDDSALGARYELEFDEIATAGDVPSAPYGGSEPMKVWMGPEDGLSGRIVSALDAAQDTAVVAMFEINTAAVINALVDAHGRGVTVVVVMDENQANDPGATADETLNGAGVKVILAHNTGGTYAEMHSKFLVVDHQRVLMGSYNWTNLGSFFNDENIVDIGDARLAARFEGKVAGLVDAYATLSPSALGLSTGSQSVSFQVSNVTLDPGVELVIESEGAGPFSPPVALTGNKLSTTVVAGTRVRYHYAVRQQDTVLAIESGSHAFTVPYAPGPFAVIDAFVP